MKQVQTIFYSWQSDLPKETNLNAIRQSLRDVANEIENEIDDTRIDLDEATRNTTGSPNIPKNIFDKISICDVFVCDLTTTNCKAPEEFKRTPNPNVLIELGYAISELGWERIIMVFNKFHGKFPTDLPFDIDRHRATPFTITDKKDKGGKSDLSKVLKDAIKLILEKSPRRPSELKTETPEQRKRKIDVSNLKWALGSIHIPTFDHFIEEIPSKIYSRIFYYKEGFSSILDSNSFHIYDQTLQQLLKKVKVNWNQTLSYGQHYGPDGSGVYYNYHLPFDMFPSEQAEKDFNKLARIREELDKDFRSLLLYIRNNYLEVDLEETSKNAFEGYKLFMEK